MILADFHVHSDNSPDGSNSIIELCESAVSKGLSYIAVTDHCEVDSFYKDRYNIGYRQSYIQAKKAMSVFKDALYVRAGVELGQATTDLSVAASITSLSYDFILGSLHALPGRADFAFLSYGSADVKMIFSDYLRELLRLVEWGGFDSLAHLTYPLRYINGENGHNLNTEEFGTEIEAVLRAIISREIALEINTSGLRQKLQLTMPDLFCLKLYKSLGGALLTIGSDSHRSVDVGSGLDKGLDIAKTAGFDQYCVYTARKPEFIKF